MLIVKCLYNEIMKMIFALQFILRLKWFYDGGPWFHLIL